MKKYLLFSFLMCLHALPAWSSSFDLGFNDTSAQAQLAIPLRSDDYGAIQFEGRALYNDQEETRLGSAGLTFVGEPGNVPGLSLGVGGLLYGGRTDDRQDLVALGVGGGLNFVPPALGGIGLAGKIYYAPRIFTGLDAERLLETGVRLSYAVTPKVRVLAEYQNIRSDFDDRGNWTIDDEIRVGFQASF
jgi:hypothetical protein